MKKRQLVYQVLGPADLDEVLSLSEALLVEAIPDEVERRFYSWGARWRREALEHYLKLGWSFIARDKADRPDPADKGESVGYFLGQPLLFFRGQTQTLWVEHIETVDAIVREGLVEVAIRVAREKNFQRVLFGAEDDESRKRLEQALGRWAHSFELEAIAEVKTKGK